MRICAALDYSRRHGYWGSPKTCRAATAICLDYQVTCRALNHQKMVYLMWKDLNHPRRDTSYVDTPERSTNAHKRSRRYTITHGTLYHCIIHSVCVALVFNKPDLVKFVHKDEFNSLASSISACSFALCVKHACNKPR